MLKILAYIHVERLVILGKQQHRAQLNAKLRIYFYLKLNMRNHGIKLKNSKIADQMNQLYQNQNLLRQSLLLNYQINYQNFKKEVLFI